MFILEKQEAKIEYNNTAVFFFQHSFKTALEHANDFIERNKGKFEMKLFTLNKSSFGGQWTWLKTVKQYKRKNCVDCGIEFLVEFECDCRCKECNKSKYEEAGRKAFCGLQYEDILRKAGLLPGGCTCQDAIDYFVEHGEELEALGLIY